jgi:hypothetical protein
VRKTVKLVGTNVVQERLADQITVGRAFALHPQENFVTHSFAACLLSSARTGACAALAGERLAPRRTTTVSLIGAGRVGCYSALYLAALGGLERLHVHDRDGRRAEGLARALAEHPAAAGLSMTVGLPRGPGDPGQRRSQRVHPGRLLPSGTWSCRLGLPVGGDQGKRILGILGHGLLPACGAALRGEARHRLIRPRSQATLAG